MLLQKFSPTELALVVFSHCGNNVQVAVLSLLALSFQMYSPESKRRDQKKREGKRKENTI